MHKKLLHKKLLIGVLASLGLFAVRLIYNVFFSGEISTTTSILMFIPSILLIVVAAIVLVSYVVDIINHKFSIFSVIFIICSIVFLAINISTIQDIPYFITGKFVNYSGFVDLYTDRDFNTHYGRSVFSLDNDEMIATMRKINSKLHTGAYEVVYLPHTKYLISFKKVVDSILLNNVKKLDVYSKPINITKSCTLNNKLDKDEISADAKITMLSYIPNKYMTEVGKLTGKDDLDTTSNGMAIKIRYDLSNIKSNYKYKRIDDIVPNAGYDFGVENGEKEDAGVVEVGFNGSVLRKLEYSEREDNEFKNGDSKSITGWIIVFPDKKDVKSPISLILKHSLIEGEAFKKVVKFDLPKEFE